MTDLRKMESAPTDGSRILAYVSTIGKHRGWTVVRKRPGWNWSTVPGDYGCTPLCWMPLPPDPTFATVFAEGDAK